jgi:acetate kinase
MRCHTPFINGIKSAVTDFMAHHINCRSPVAQLMQKEFSSLKIITCHLGNGASITAVDRGKSVETSMGFTPLEGLIMGTRAGDIDPAIIPYVMAKEELSLGEGDAMLNKHSGVLGISGIGSDMRDIEKAAEEGHERAQLALDMYRYRIRKYIGAYVAAMNGVDAIVFTAGIGENDPGSRAEIGKQLSFWALKWMRNEIIAEEWNEKFSTRRQKLKCGLFPRTKN